MGLWDQFLVVGSESTDVGVPGVPGVQPLGSQGGWQFFRLPVDWSIAPSEAVEQATRTANAPAIGGFVLDSDSAALWFDDAEGRSGWLTINPAYDDSMDELTERWADADARHEAADELARWASANAPKQPSAEEIVARLAGLEDERLSSQIGMPAMLFAEDGLSAVFEDLLGFPSLEATVFSAGRED
jgi:hypothetical protein